MKSLYTHLQQHICSWRWICALQRLEKGAGLPRKREELVSAECLKDTESARSASKREPKSLSYFVSLFILVLEN